MQKKRMLCVLLMVVLLVTGCSGNDPLVSLATQAWHKAGQYGRPVEGIEFLHMEYTSKQELGERCGESYVDMVKGFGYLPEKGHIFLIQYYGTSLYGVVVSNGGQATKLHDFNQQEDPQSLAEAEDNLFFALLGVLAAFSPAKDKGSPNAFHYLTEKQVKRIE